MWRVSSSISPMAMPAVGLPNEPVPQTATPRSVAATTSIEALRMPVVIRSLSLGSFSITARGKAVRSRLHHIVRCAEMFVEDLDVEIARDLRPVGRLESHVLVVVENCAAVLGHVVWCPLN